jgi:crotonobetainyl-CoA:carnitine CoA-transferase CaiB-like acyl-CoA transferase
MLLGDLGATVIKVESPSGDETRTWLPPGRNGVATYYLAINRNKRSITLDPSPISFSLPPPRHTLPPPTLGQDNEQIRARLSQTPRIDPDDLKVARTSAG